MLKLNIDNKKSEERSDDNFKDHIYALIVAGGGGTRMWPKSREATPKQFLKLFNKKTLMQITSERLGKIIPWKNIYVITVSNAYKKEIVKEVPKLHPKNIIVEPMRRDSAPAYALGAMHIYKKDPNAVIINSAADHLLSPQKEYKDTLMVCSEVAYKEKVLVAVGIHPFYPHTGMGHLKRGKRHSVVQDRVVYELDKFVEKPDLSLAKRYTHSGKYYWNAAQYVWRADAIIKAIKKHAPKIYAGLTKIEKSIGTTKEKSVIVREYKKMPKISIDYAVSEKAKNFMLVPAHYSWTDVGDWNEVWKHLPKDRFGNAIIDANEPGGEIINIDTSDALIQPDGRLIALVDVDDIVVIDTKEILLVCKKNQAQNVKKIVNQLREKGRKDML